MAFEPRTSDEIESYKIMLMSEGELLDYVIENAEYLTDRYYMAFANAVYARHKELVAWRVQ